MIRVYFLEVETINNTEVIKGIEHIHNASLICTEYPGTRKLIQDTTDDEHAGLIAAAVRWRAPTPEEAALLETPPPPDPDIARVQQILGNSPQAIPAPQMWELLRIYGKKLGYIR